MNRLSIVIQIVGTGIACAVALAASAIPSSQPLFTTVVETDTQSQVVELKLVVRSGSLSDPEATPGLTYYTARALLRGTRTRPYADLSGALERLTATVNVDTDQAKTIFNIQVPVANLDPLLDLLRDVFSQPAFDVIEMDQLQKNLQSELRMALQNASAATRRALMMAAYGTARMASPYGTVEGIGKITPRDLAAFFKAKYVRQNMLIAITSPLTEQEAIARVATKLDAIPEGVLDAPMLPAAQFRNRRALIVPRAAPTGQAGLHGVVPVPLWVATDGVSDGHPDRIAIDLGNLVFGATDQSRLTSTLVTQLGWAQSARSDLDRVTGPQREAALFTLEAVLNSEYVDRAIPRAVEMFDAYSMRGVTASEFQAARDELALLYPSRIDTSSERLDHKIRGVLHQRRSDTVDDYRARLAALELTALNRLIATATPASRLWIATIGDPSVLGPILAAVPGVEAVDVLDVQP